MKAIKESWVIRFIRYVIDWRQTRGIIRELDALTDKQLKDIGMTRGEITNLIYRMKEEENEK